MRDDEREINHHGTTRNVGGGDDDELNATDNEGLTVSLFHILIYTYF